MRYTKKTEQLQEQIQLLRQQLNQLHNSYKKTHFQLSNLGKDTEDQIIKNKPAMEWAERQLEEFKKIVLSKIFNYDCYLRYNL
ncbi:MAG: hypothetical protein AB4041_13315 [Microcystaceae cyanobacterium]